MPSIKFMQVNCLLLNDRCHSTVTMAAELVQYVFAMKVGKRKQTMYPRKTSGSFMIGAMWRSRRQSTLPKELCCLLYPSLNIRKLEQHRLERQRERQKSSRDKQNNNFARASRCSCTFLLLHVFDVKLPSFTFHVEREVKTMIRELEQHRWERQRERQKSSRDKQNNNFARASRFSCIFLCHCTTMT